MAQTELTPMMRQYLQIKEQNKDCILFFRLGDFYEMFSDDARLASRELDLTLTTRDRGKAKEDQTPMCGVPYHSAEAYIARLVAKGYKVAICEQTEDPATAKGLVDRDIVRIVSPGTVTESSMLEEGRNNYMACVYGENGSFGLAFCDVSTGVFYATSASGEGAMDRVTAALGRFSPVEVIRGGQDAKDPALESVLFQKLGCCVDDGSPAQFDIAQAEALLEGHFGKDLGQLALAGQEMAIRASGALLRALLDNQKNDLKHIQVLEYYAAGKFMELDLTARRNLELTETLRGKEKKGSLLWVLDKTKTAMGGRLLRSWLEKPLLDRAEIVRRQEAVAEFLEDAPRRGALVEALKEISDLERICARIATGSAGGRDLVSLAQGCSSLPQLKEAISGYHCRLLSRLCGDLDDLADITSLISETLVDEPPFTIREGGMIRPGADQEIDRLRDIMNGGTGTMAAIEAEAREKTGIRTLRVGYNRVFGYYIEVSKSFVDQVPPEYIRKQTLVNCERYITPELKELENTILSAKDRVTELEYQRFCALRSHIAGESSRIQKTASVVAALDTLCSLASVAAQNGYCRPEVTEGREIIIKEGRHPVVERVLKDSLFVPNDTELGLDNIQVDIITGPNMAGKSTYMRQVALIVILAQMGSFVPARSAKIGIVDRVFTRIGASDDLASGQSTFMVEMWEVAQILKYATSRSLLILDEIGRGTSTYDGMAIARAVLEYAADSKRLGAKTLFATHYHELTDLEQSLPGVRNLNIAVKKRSGDMIFLRKIIPGPADGSYGVEVAKLAGLPKTVVRRAYDILQELESGEVSAPKAAPAPQDQVSMADLAAQDIRAALEQITVETLTPIEAMNELYKLKKMLN